MLLSFLRTLGGGAFDLNKLFIVTKCPAFSFHIATVLCPKKHGLPKIWNKISP